MARRCKCGRYLPKAKTHFEFWMRVIRTIAAATAIIINAMLLWKLFLIK